MFVGIMFRPYRKVFNMNMWESVKSIQFLCGRLDFVHTALHRKLKFLNGLYKTNSLIVKECCRNVMLGLGLESYVKIVMWWLTVTVYDMTFILSSSRCVDCSLSVFSVFFYFHCIAFLPLW